MKFSGTEVTRLGSVPLTAVALPLTCPSVRSDSVQHGSTCTFRLLQEQTWDTHFKSTSPLPWRQGVDYIHLGFDNMKHRSKFRILGFFNQMSANQHPCLYCQNLATCLRISTVWKTNICNREYAWNVSKIICCCRRNPELWTQFLADKYILIHLNLILTLKQKDKIIKLGFLTLLTLLHEVR